MTPKPKGGWKGWSVLARRDTWLSTNPPMLGLRLGVLTEPEGLGVCDGVFVMVRVEGGGLQIPPTAELVMRGLCECVSV